MLSEFSDWDGINQMQDKVSNDQGVSDDQATIQEAGSGGGNHRTSDQYSEQQSHNFVQVPNISLRTYG